MASNPNAPGQNKPTTGVTTPLVQVAVEVPEATAERATFLIGLY